MKTGMFAVALLSSVLGATAFGETADQVADLQRQRDAAQARRDIADAEAEEAKTKLGTLDTSGLPKGTGEATSLNVEGKILAYNAVRSIASEIATKVAAKKPDLIAIYSEKEFTGILQLRAFLQQSAEVHKVVNQTINLDPAGKPSLPKLESDAACGGVLPAKNVDTEAGGGVAPFVAIGAVLQLLSIAKTDKKITGADVEISDTALTNAVAGKLLESGIVVVYPATFAASTSISKTGVASSKVIEESQKLANDSTVLDIFVSMSVARRQDLEKRSSAQKVTDSCKALFARDGQVLSTKEALAKALKASIDQQTASLLKADDKTAISPLQSMYESELIQTKFTQKENPYVLQITPIAAGGTTLTKTNFFTTNFYFTGGAVVSYSLTSSESGNVVLADTLTTYGGFVKAQDLSSLR